MSAKPSHFRWSVLDGATDQEVASAKIVLYWDVAPRTCRALTDMVLLGAECSGELAQQQADGLEVSIVHARHSGGEALFVTPSVISNVGDENNGTLEYKQGDMLFCFEPKFCCEHAKEDASEVAWIYHGAAQPRRWLSKALDASGAAGDPTNQTGPWETVDVRLNRWGKVVQECGFYALCAALPRTGELKMRISCLDEGVKS